MAYIYESDVGRLGGNLQTTVAYLLSLHKAEYEWNLLGIKVVGHVDALPIPDGTYEYGDAYTVGTAAPYDMWIYTRADAFHSEAYWFNIGKFPAPGPQGPKGDGLEQITNINSRVTDSLTYNSTDGGDVTSNARVTYKDSTTGEYNTEPFKMFYKLPIIPGKYISMDATSDNKKMEVKVDDTELALDYYKADKTGSNIPAVYLGKIVGLIYGPEATPNSVVRRDNLGSATFHNVRVGNAICDVNGSYLTDARILAYAANKSYADLLIAKTSTDIGTLDSSQLNTLQSYPQLHIIYDNQAYYRMDPTNAPDDTLNFIHIDSIDDGNGGYKATGKCFSITVSTRAWKVFDLDFGGSTRTTHNLTLTNSSTGMSVYFSLTNNRPETYEGFPAGLWSALETSQIACTVDANGTYSAGMITVDGDNFKVFYGNGEEVRMEQTVIAITDNMV